MPAICYNINDFPVEYHRISCRKDIIFCQIANMNHNRIVRYRERYHQHSYRDDPFVPPLRVHLCGVSRWGPGDAFGRDAARIMSINVVTRGSIVFEQNGRRDEVFGGQVFLPRKGGTYRFETGTMGYVHKRFMLISGGLLDLLLGQLGLDSVNVVSSADADAVVDLMRRSYAVMREKPPQFTVALSGMAYRLLCLLAGGVDRQYPEELRAIMTYMKKHLSEPLSLDQLCSHAGISARKCNRLFNEYFNMSPIQYLLQHRMSCARELVVHSNLTIKAIADMLGYDQPFYFSNQFKKYHGISPLLYREHANR